MNPILIRRPGRAADRNFVLKAAACVALLATLSLSDALADDRSLAGSLWTCTRARDASQFLIAFYPAGGVGGGEFQNGEVSPYVFDLSGVQKGQWPGHWEQKGRSFTWDFPDQHMRITGSIAGNGRRATMTGMETASGVGSAVECRSRSRLPRIGEGLVIPKDGHFIDLEGGEGTLKVPAGISLQSR